MTDDERMEAAREFVWRALERTGDNPPPHQLNRAIKAAAEALPPFTKIKPK